MSTFSKLKKSDTGQQSLLVGALPALLWVAKSDYGTGIDD